MPNPTGVNQYSKGRVGPGLLRANAVRRSDLVHDRLKAKPHALVGDLIKRFPTMGQQKAYLGSLPSAKLSTAYKLTTGAKDVGSKLVRDSIKQELSRRKK